MASKVALARIPSPQGRGSKNATSPGEVARSAGEGQSDSEIVTHCFHCGEPLLGSTLTARIDDRAEPVCCHGCLAVAELIAGAGLSDYYRFREQASARPQAADFATDTWAAYAKPEIAAPFLRTQGDVDSVTLAVEGLRCAACSWLIDQVLQGINGVCDAATNASTGRAHVAWNHNVLTLADILRSIARLGYRPTPLSTAAGDTDTLQLQQRERRDALKRLAVAGLGMMQVMMFAVAGYAAQLSGEVMDPRLDEFFRLVSLLVATPVMFYSAAPILAGAFKGLRARAISMDVPVSVALVLAYSASVINSVAGRSGEVYFDSVTMFVFFLMLGRFVQMSVRHRTTSISDALARQLPSHAHCIEAGEVREVPAAGLQQGDLILVRHGEIIPADGELLEAEADIDEAILSGESLPVQRKAGDAVIAGTLNLHHPIHVRVTATGRGAGTVLSHIMALMQRAQTQRPAMSCAADAAAARFLRYVLLGAGLTCAAWLGIDPTRAFEATLAVLVVACPCAFAIAMPAALSAATAHLAGSGMLITKPDALETLAGIDTMVFDKTGTLTEGRVAIERCTPLAEVDEARCLEIAAALELASEHPLARAFRAHGSVAASDVRVVPGRGLEGVVEGKRYRVGAQAFVAPGCRELSSQHAAGATTIALSDGQRLLARIDLRDLPRCSAPGAIAALQSIQIDTQLLSGDGDAAVTAIAHRCGIGQSFARCSPARKLALVQALQAEGKRVAMIGDGVNDAPVLAAADVSIAMGRGAALAHASADMVLINENLAALPKAVEIARRTLEIARQNMIWAVAYNFGSLPLAALGWIPPWAAALGMSLSSIGVVLNATRLLPSLQPSPAGEGWGEGRATAPASEHST